MTQDIAVRRSRKLDHIDFSLDLADGPASNRFDDFHLLHNCLPELALSEVCLPTRVGGVALAHPVIINAITGGTDDVTAINEKLAEVAKMTGSAMAVGSQFSAMRDPAAEASYQIVRQVNPTGIVFANLGAHASVEQACRAVDMLGAAALQIHLNPAQELMMPEGDRTFKGYLENISAIVNHVPVSVIVKETGCGMAREQVAALLAVGVKVIDIGGAGGTNFLAIESARDEKILVQSDLAWGIPAALSAAEAVTVLPSTADLIVSGGIRTPMEAVKALAMGAKAVALAAPVLRLVMKDGVEAAAAWLNEFTHNIRRFILLTGCTSCADLARVPLVVTGFSREWLTARGIDTNLFARR